jgi:hypothetical protein
VEVVVNLQAFRQEVHNKLDAQIDACREYLVEWFRDEADLRPTSEELDALAAYTAAHILNTDMWHDHNAWDEVLEDLRKRGLESLLKSQVKSEDGSYWTS